MNTNTVRIGGASGFWGDASIATAQLLADEVDFLVYDYLAEVTMSILARARGKSANAGFAADFVEAAMAPSLKHIAEKHVKVLANAGGVNPRACAQALRREISAQGLSLRVAVVLGDDLMAQSSAFQGRGVKDMFSNAAFPAADRVASINAYLGAFPIAAALDAGADIVVTGRCVDSALTLGACIHRFGWGVDDFDRLAAGSLAGHILECGTQATGGNFTDWESVATTLVDAGYPIAEIEPSGEFICTKPERTGGIVNVGTVAEQLLYEIGDPTSYILPDVVCDFSDVNVEAAGVDRVRVSGARGSAPTDSYKVSATFEDGFRGGEQWTVYGRDAEKKARVIAETALLRARRALKAKKLADFTETSIEIIGAETHYGAARRIQKPREVQLKLAVKHAEEQGVATLFKEFVGAGLSAPPGLTSFAGGRPRPSPVIRLFSFLIPKQEVVVTVEMDDRKVPWTPAPVRKGPIVKFLPQIPPESPQEEALATVSLEQLAWARSGDKGDFANIGVIARKRAYMPYIWKALTPQRVADRFVHFLKGPVERFYLPGPPAINFLLHDVLGGGGVASLRADPQGKGYAQILLEEIIEIPAALLEEKK